MGAGVRRHHAAVRRGVSAAAVLAALRAPPARLVRAEAPRRGLGGDVRRVDDAGARLARASTRDRPTALAKLVLCDKLIARDRRRAAARHRRRARRGRRRRSRMSLERLLPQLRGAHAPKCRPGLDGSLRALFAPARARAPAAERRRPTALLRRLEPTLCTEVYRWTGHFPERTRPLVRQLAERSAAMALDYAAGRRGARDGGADGARHRARHEPRAPRKLLAVSAIGYLAGGAGGAAGLGAANSASSTAALCLMSE